MGDFTGIRDSELRVYCFTPHFGEDPPVPLWRPKGMTDGIGRLTADRSAPANRLLCFARNPFSRIDPM